jgi:hypothetical protein
MWRSPPEGYLVLMATLPYRPTHPREERTAVDIPSGRGGSFDIRKSSTKGTPVWDARVRPSFGVPDGCGWDGRATVWLQVPELVPVLIPVLMSPTRILRWWLAVRAPGLSLRKESELEYEHDVVNSSHCMV